MISLTESKRTFSKNEYGVWRPEPLKYHPVRKALHFDPQPVAGNIPYYADIQRNPMCEDTIACREFWDEQFEYCIHGYTTAGHFIPGRLYYFLNFRQITGVKGKQYPWFTDMQTEYEYLIGWVKANKWTGIIGPKARRKGFSEYGVNVLEHGVRFIDGYRGGICAGLSNYVDGFKTKMDIAEQEIRPELKMNTLTNNKSEIDYGYRIRNIMGNIEDDGCRSKILMATMYDDPKKFEGEYFNDVVLEESGEFPLLGSTYESIRPGLMMGSEVGGTFYIYGTGGNILSSSRGFKQLYDQSESLKLARFEVIGQRMLYPFIGLTDKVKDRMARKGGEQLKQEMPSFSGWTEQEMIGCEDIWRSEEWIISEDERYQQLAQKKELREHRQNFPRNVDDIFTSAGKNNFDSDTLYFSLNLAMQEEPMYEKCVLEFEKNITNDGEFLKFPLNVIRRPWTERDPDWKMILVMKGQKPSAIINMDTGGTDAYEADESLSSASKLGVIVLRDFRYSPSLCPFPERNAILPVCAYYDRPPKRKLSFEISYTIAVYWNLKRNMMVSAEHESCMEYYKNNQGQRLLSLRPKSMDSAQSQQVHKYGVKMTPFSKPRTIAIAQDYVSEWGHLLRLEALIRDYLAYDEENIGTDWDLADACNNALVRIRDRKGTPVVHDEDKPNLAIENNNRITYYYNDKGVLCAKIPPPREKEPAKYKKPEEEKDYINC